MSLREDRLVAYNGHHLPASNPWPSMEDYNSQGQNWRKNSHVGYESANPKNVELLASPTSRPISSLTYNPQQDLQPLHSALIDQDRVQLDTPQPLINDAPLPWSKYTVSSDVQQQSETTPSFNLLNLDSLTEEELYHPIAVNSLDDQAEFISQREQQPPVDNDIPADVLLNELLNDNCNDDVNSGKQIVVLPKRSFQKNNVNSPIFMGSETLSNENDQSFMNSTINLEPWIEQMPNDEKHINRHDKTVKVTAMSKKCREVMIDSPSPSSSSPRRSSNVAQRAVPYPLYRERRDRNNEASRKSREKRKAKQKEMEDELNELKAGVEEVKKLKLQNQALLADITSLNATVKTQSEILLQKDKALHDLLTKVLHRQ
uniref:BZIP domain-containing protein n=1 Tax=Plectus sambesii TaxID=2011161 RepID=A0A914UME9_9BILA